MTFTGIAIEESWDHEEPSLILRGGDVVERHRGSTPLAELAAAAVRLAGPGRYTWSFDHVTGYHYLYRA